MRLPVLVLLCTLLSLPARAEGVRPMAGKDVETITTPHFRFEFPHQQAPLARRISGKAEALRTELCGLIKPCFRGPIVVQVARTEEQFLALQPYGAHIDWAAGVAYGKLGLIILRVDKEILLSIEETFDHELSHVLLLNAVKSRPPRWFIEGMAIIQARQNLIERFEKVASASLSDSTLSLAELAHNFPASAGGRALAYAQSGLFVAHLRSTYGDARLAEFVRALSHSPDFHASFRQVYGTELGAVEEEWHKSLGSYAWVKALTDSWLLWSLTSLLFLFAVWVKWRRTRRRKGEMEREERDWEYRTPFS